MLNYKLMHTRGLIMLNAYEKVFIPFIIIILMVGDYLVYSSNVASSLFIVLGDLSPLLSP
ncbi:hypothetical protein [Clostridium manihotivorum]|uniref:Uncharacterized protein n=1 Tax=Clostridium manihotivorum TaxID=2320868 RepID=A0A410DPI4_9CLOT|nr:hypothetical protein [Clostridium manihotivorum]QAA30960.1 hypothetical protein C1I91_04360 [Clostridium manihotivorum]